MLKSCEYSSGCIAKSSNITEKRPGAKSCENVPRVAGIVYPPLLRIKLLCSSDNAEFDLPVQRSNGIDQIDDFYTRTASERGDMVVDVPPRVTWIFEQTEDGADQRLRQHGECVVGRVTKDTDEECVIGRHTEVRATVVRRSSDRCDHSQRLVRWDLR